MGWGNQIDMGYYPGTSFVLNGEFMGAYYITKINYIRV